MVAASAAVIFVGGLYALAVASNGLLGGVLIAVGVGDALAAFILWQRSRKPA